MVNYRMRTDLTVLLRWFSGTTIWAYTIYGAETIYVTVIFKERLNLILQSGKRFDEYIYGIIFLSILIPHFLLPVGAWTNGSEVAKFKNMWTRFQTMTSTITYLVMLMQFRLTLMRNAALAARRAAAAAKTTAVSLGNSTTS